MKVLNLFGGPGTGKSTLAAYLFQYYKVRHYNVELVTEYAKDLTYEKRHTLLLEDQLYILSKQNRRLLRLKSSVDLAITDSPLLLSSIYASLQRHPSISLPILQALNFEIWNLYSNYNLLLERCDLPYSVIGRNQTLEEAKDIDSLIKNFLVYHKIPVQTVLITPDYMTTFENAVELVNIILGVQGEY